jgi:pyrimidine-nucleoside phosphorylase
MVTKATVVQIKEFIIKKRNGEAHTEQELVDFLKHYHTEKITDHHMSAWLMSVYYKGLNEVELKTLIREMWKTGKSIHKTSKKHFYVDKHSTGGVGDKTSLLLVPLVMAVGEKLLGKNYLKIPMVSGRGLGQTGGTLDKLESVPGFKTNIPLTKAHNLLKKHGFFMIGQTKEMTPLDRKLYALRDITGTVDCIPLIVASILSKKLSENLDGLVLDVKMGRGAFMKTEVEAKALSEALTYYAKLNGLEAISVITKMDSPLGNKIGNFLEVEECQDFLEGKAIAKDLYDVTLDLASRMIYLASRKKISIEEAKKECVLALKTTKPIELFNTMLSIQGGNLKKLSSLRDNYKKNLLQTIYRAPQKGKIKLLDALTLGVLVNSLGGGRQNSHEKIDPIVGIEIHKKLDTTVEKGDKILTVYHRKKNSPQSILSELVNAIQINS